MAMTQIFDPHFEFFGAVLPLPCLDDETCSRPSLALLQLRNFLRLFQQSTCTDAYVAQQ